MPSNLNRSRAVIRFREYRPRENAFGPPGAGASGQVHPYNPRKQRKNPAATGSREAFTEGKWRRERDCRRTFSGPYDVDLLRTEFQTGQFALTASLAQAPFSETERDHGRSRYRSYAKFPRCCAARAGVHQRGQMEDHQTDFSCGREPRVNRRSWAGFQGA